MRTAGAIPLSALWAVLPAAMAGALLAPAVTAGPGCPDVSVLVMVPGTQPYASMASLDAIPASTGDLTP